MTALSPAPPHSRNRRPLEAFWQNSISAQATPESKPFTQTWLMATLNFYVLLNGYFIPTLSTLKYLIFIDVLYVSHNQRETTIHEAQYKNKQTCCFYFLRIYRCVLAEHLCGIHPCVCAVFRRDALGRLRCRYGTRPDAR
ncbi:hypothetical protein BN77_1928 [Rhizobium mesoamericanum STM3625]|uniref:Uncharacterized protein n=1 Tax=Rhizobium mesoamericanum STM3625 TaxID=1211777 RepID=K0PY03_9HYPH|nr:hypothetical protein BN77_1928 [Rhizobium mesoamericanum STM3625]